MTSPQDIIGQSVARLNEAAASAREVLTELHGTIKDARQVIKGVKQNVADLLFLSANLAKREVEGEVKDLVEKAVSSVLAELGEATAKEMEKSVAKVNAEFDKLANLLLGKDDGKVPLEALIRQRIRIDNNQPHILQQGED